MPKVTANGIQIYYEEYGKGEPVILIPGLGGTNKLWYLQIPALAEHFRVIALDNRGAGDSDKPLGPYTMDMFSDDINALIQSLALPEPVNVIAASLGGIMAQTFIHHHPEKVKRLVLVCTGVSGGDPHYVPMAPEILAQVSNPGDSRETRVDTILSLFYHPQYITNNPGLRTAFLSQKVDDLAAQAYFWQLAAAADSRPYYEWLGEIRCPVLIMHGKQDRIWPLKNAEILKQGIGKNAELYVMEDSEHMFFQEKADEFNKRLMQFLKK